MEHEYGAVVARSLQGSRSSWRKISSSAILSTTDVGSNTCLRGKGPATNRLSNGTVTHTHTHTHTYIYIYISGKGKVIPL